MGSLSEQDYDAVAQELELNNLIEKIPDFSKFYVNCSAER
jgi:hypothetical protein